MVLNRVCTPYLGYPTCRSQRAKLFILSVAIVGKLAVDGSVDDGQGLMK